MYISARERQVLDILLSEKDEMTVKDLADQIGVSGRTIHRDLKNVEDILKEYDLELHKKSGVGVQITGDQKKIQELELYLYNLSHTEYTPEERQTIILCSLLESDGPVKLLGLANDLNVTIATVSADLTKLEERLQNFDLSLVRRRGYGVELEGHESSKRSAMSSLITGYIDESEILSLARETIQKRSNQQINTISERLLGLVEKKKLHTVERIVDETIQELPFKMADSAYIGLVVHLALAVERIQKGEGIKIKQSYLEDQQATKEYRFAEKIVAQLEQVFQIEIPQAEVAYITMHLKGAKLRHDNELLVEDSSFQLAIKTKNLIELVGKRIGRDLTKNHSLLEGLMIHLKPAIYRLKQKMGISNPLLSKIKQDYGELFDIVKESVEEVLHEFYVPDEEIGYLVMHFGAAILVSDEPVYLKTLVICSSGIGTSKMLATRLKQEFPELKEVRNVSVLEFKKMDPSEYPLIISTVPIPDYHLDYILVSPILTKEEIEKVRSYLSGRIHSLSSAEKIASVVKDHHLKKSPARLIEEMKSLYEYTKTIAIVLDGFYLKKISKALKTEEVLQLASNDLFERQKVNNKKAIVNAVLEREKIGGLGIPGTSMGLYHTRSPNVLEPAFTIYVLQEAITIEGMDNQEQNMKTMLLMLSPEQASEKVLEVLSYLSSILIENDESMNVFQSENEEKVLLYLTERLDQFFNNKLKEIRSV